MISPRPDITLKGKVKEAIQFYEQAIGAVVLSLATYGDMPDMPETFTDEFKEACSPCQAKSRSAPGFGDVTDKFGVSFQIYTELLD